MKIFELFFFFQRSCLGVCYGYPASCPNLKSRLCEKYALVPLFRAIVRERLRWLGHCLRTNDEILQKIVFFGQTSKAKRKAGHPRIS